MGLDAVELILAVEDAFRIHISDEEASAVSTVDDLHALVISKLREPDSKRCLTSAAFYRVRRGIVETLGLNRRQIRPSTPLEAILPPNGRRQNWYRIQETTKLKLPALRHPPLLQAILLALGAALAVAPGLYARIAPAWFLLLPFPGLIVGSLFVRLSPWLATAFPPHTLTVGGLSRDVLAINHARLSEELGAWNEQDVWECLCRLVAHRTGMSPTQINRDSRLFDDLGID